jgi:hypothetical protein
MKQYDVVNDAMSIEQLSQLTITGGPEYVDSIYEVGIIHPIVLGEYRKKVFVIAGNRRIASFIAAYERASADGSLAKRCWLDAMPVRIWKGISPEDRATLSLIENEERGDNIILSYITIQQLKEAGKWDEVQEILKLNKGREDHFNRLSKIHPDFLQAFVEGKIAQGNLFSISSISPTRQDILLETLSANGKIVAPDIKAAKSAQVTAAVRRMAPLPEMPETPESLPKVETYFIVLRPEIIQDSLYTNITEALAESRASGDKVFRLIPVN